MRFRISVLMPLAAALALILTGCAAARVGRAPTATPGPVKTLRPTFTYTPARPKATPTPAGVAAPTGQPVGQQAAPLTATLPPASPTPAPPSPTPAPPSPTPEMASFTVTSPGETNVRSGPGTGYPRIGTVQQGQSYEILGKNSDATWWQFTFSGQAGWISGQMVNPNAAAQNVQVAANIAPPPTSPPAPPRPPAAPTQPPAPPPPVSLFVQTGAEFRNADQANFSIVTFWGRLGQTGGTAIGGGYKLKVSAPTGSGQVVFGEIWQVAYPGLGSAEFRYNAKLELPRTAGGYRAVVTDGSGKEVSDVITGDLLDRTHDVILTWWPR